MTERISPAEIQASYNSLAEYASYSHLRPLAEAARRLVTDTQSTRRVFTGIAPLDHEMRGISAGHLAMIVGYSHSGKTLVALHIIANNADKRVCYFVPDEPAPLILMKLACMRHGVSGRELEARLRDREPWGQWALDETIASFPGLVVFDRPLTPQMMEQAYAEACSHWGAEADLVVVDYLDLLQCGGEVMGKANAFKSFGSVHEVPMLVLHQTSRTAGARGQAMRIDSGSYGGETHATFQIGVWRKLAGLKAALDDLQARSYRSSTDIDKMMELEREVEVHRYTLSVNLNKNKRPSGRLVDELAFEMDLDTGALSLMEPGDLPRQWRQQSYLRRVL